MTRIILFLIAIGALALGASWLADRPGDVVVTWQGMRIETSVMVLGAARSPALAVLVWPGSLLSRHRPIRHAFCAIAAPSPRRTRL